MGGFLEVNQSVLLSGRNRAWKGLLAARIPAYASRVPQSTKRGCCCASRKRPAPVPGKRILPIFHADGGMQLLEFDHDDPEVGSLRSARVSI